MNLVTQSHDDALVVRLEEERLDAAIAIRFKAKMREIVAWPARRIVLDLSHVTFLDSSGLGALVAVLKATQPERRLALCGLTPNVARVLRLTHMDSVFDVIAPAAGTDSARPPAA